MDKRGRMMRLAQGLLAAALAAAAPMAPSRADDAATATAAISPEAALIAAVNGERARSGLAPLAAETRLACAARAHARDLAVHRLFSHSGSDGGDLAGRLARAGYAYAMAAENLALAGPGTDEVVRLWRESPGHARNMNAADARAAGAAREHAADGRFLWVLVVGAERRERGSALGAEPAPPSSALGPNPPEKAGDGQIPPECSGKSG